MPIVAHDVFIAVRDGARLSARVWLPETADGPWPALLEYIPYRKNDFTALRDSLRHPWFAARGYACVRVDMRGSGDSDGLLLDEYLALEQDDACDVIAWIAAQPWCTGAVGMFGKSWGGFNALQVAARRPPALRAIITIYSTDDRYADDVHYRGGAVLASEALSWATTMLAYNARPPDPLRRPADWRTLWQDRLDHTPPFAEAWFTHQSRDAYWRHGSVCEDFDAIAVPVFAVGGWADGYTDPVLRLMAGLRVPRLGLIGPWVHEFPEVAVPQLVRSPWAPTATEAGNALGAPERIGFLQESLRWWDQWLKGRDTGILREPMLRAFLQDSAPAHPDYDVRAGRWTGCASWPSAAARVETLPITAGDIPADTLHGAQGGVWCAYGAHDDPSGEQSSEDARCLVFDFAPVTAVTAYLGFPNLKATLRAERETAHLVARLCDVAPDGSSTLISNGVLDLCRRADASKPAPLPPGVPFEIVLRLDALGHRLLPGHHWRLALNQIWWPRIWPNADVAGLALIAGTLDLPLHDEDDDAVVRFDTAETAPRLAQTVLKPAHRRRSIRQEGETSLLTDDQDDGLTRLDDSGARDDAGVGLERLTFGAASHDVYRIDAGKPASAAIECRRSIALGREAWSVTIEAVGRLSLSADGSAFLLENALVVDEDGQPIARRDWRTHIPIERPRSAHE